MKINKKKVNYKLIRKKKSNNKNALSQMIKKRKLLKKEKINCSFNNKKKNKQILKIKRCLLGD